MSFGRIIENLPFFAVGGCTLGTQAISSATGAFEGS